LSEEEFYYLANAIKLFHQATLIYDDVLDNSDFRDGNRITLHNKFGEKNISSCGKADHLASILVICSEKELNKLNDLDLIKRFADFKLELFKAQLVDTFVIKKPKNLSYLEWLIKYSYRKTNAFFEFIFSIYATRSNKRNEDLEETKKIGKIMGILYQIGDDLFEIDNGVNYNTTSLTYNLSYLLDNKKLLNREENNFLKNFIKNNSFSDEEFKKLNEIMKKYEDKIVLSAQKRFKEYLEIIQKTNQINDFIKEEIIDFSNRLLDSKYWNYKA
jgi:geranylgeranyl pyrophosphate synthase